MARSKNRSESRRVSLGEDLRIARAAEVASLLASASDADSIEIEAAQVERVDAAGLQALAVGIARLRKAKVACHWSGVSPVLAASAALAGLAEALELS
jgi:anti-anti-sigma regulatory factor